MNANQSPLEYAVFSRATKSLAAAFTDRRDAVTWATCGSLTGDTMEVWRIYGTDAPPALVATLREGKHRA